jgi:hypothetical protein
MDDAVAAADMPVQRRDRIEFGSCVDTSVELRRLSGMRDNLVPARQQFENNKPAARAGRAGYENAAYGLALYRRTEIDVP